MRNTSPHATNNRAPATPFDGSDMPQYSLRQIFGVWTAVTIPMSIIGWVIALAQSPDRRS